MRPCQVFDTLEALRTSFSGSLCREGVRLSPNDTRTVLDAYLQWLALAYDLEYLHPDTLTRDSRRLFTSMVTVDVLDLLSALAECYHLLQMGTDNGFKAHCAVVSPHLFTLVKRDLQNMMAGDLYSHKRLIQLFSYLTRLSLREIDLSQQCVRDYLESEEAIPQVYPSGLVSSLNKIVKGWLGPFVPYEIVPGHGPGSVAGIAKPTLFDKYFDLCSDARLRYAFGNDWWCPRPVRTKLVRTSQTIFVPKSYKTFRTISMEPATLQYFQQGVWKVIDKYVRFQPYLRNHFDFHDEGRNRALAQRGSIDGSYATIDLSAASDSVGYELVKRVFSGTWLLRYVVATRSTETLLPTGSKVLLRKFAPMGSALCFPIETLLFGAICAHVTRGLGVPGDFSVYGDDIIVPTCCVDRLIRVLSNLGFRVNLKKSFTGTDCHYRESCGGEFVSGFDVTPMRISRKYNSSDCCDRFTSLISLANEAYERAFYCLRYFFIRKMRDNRIHPLFGSTSLLSGSSTNYHLRSRWNPDLQRQEVRASALIARQLTSLSEEDIWFPLYEEVRYRHWLESTYLRPRLEWAFQAYVGETTEFVSYQWFDAPDGANEKASSDDDQIFSSQS